MRLTRRSVVGTGVLAALSPILDRFGVRRHGEGDLGSMPVADFAARSLEEISSRR